MTDSIFFEAGNAGSKTGFKDRLNAGGMAGYSGTPLVKKLGIKAGQRIYVADAPAEYFHWLHPLPEHVEVRATFSSELDFIHLFVQNDKLFRALLLKGKKSLRSNGMLWVSWPKKASRVATDLDENTIRDFGLKSGLVDVKVCAVDDVWSALKFVIPVKDRT
jgi:hypothetical protein